MVFAALPAGVVPDFDPVILPESLFAVPSLVAGVVFASVGMLCDVVADFASVPGVAVGWAKTVTGSTARTVANRPVVASVKRRFIDLLLCAGGTSKLRLQSEHHSIVSRRRWTCGRTKAN